MVGLKVLIKEGNLYRGSNVTEKTDRDLLVELSTDVRWIKLLLTGHIAHHKRLFFAGLAVIGSLFAAMVLLIVTR